MKTIINGRILTDSGIIEGKNVILDEGRIISIDSEIPEGSDIIDACGSYVSPGFIDIHIHGAGGQDTMDGEYNSLNSISKTLASHGVTSFLPTTMTAETGQIKKALKAVKECMDKGTEGAQVLGAHLEGPFLNEKAKGAHDERLIHKPDIEFLLDITDEDLSMVRTLTIAPEVEGALDFISFIVGHGIIPSVGHSNGTYDEIMEGIGRGVTHSTHLYNAMRGFSHREPGVVGAIFDSRVTTEFIADGIHLHFAAIRAAIAVKGYQNCALITDAMQACCMEDGKYNLGGLNVFVKDGAARLADGTLAGSTLTLDTAIRNIIKNTSLSLWEAVCMASSVPAKILRLGETKGHISPGYDADLVIFDQDINVKTTISGGKIVYC